jgi:hypothetical protein
LAQIPTIKLQKENNLQTPTINDPKFIVFGINLIEI